MIRIGVVNIDTSHPLAFAEYLQQGNRAKYVAVYNDAFRGDDEVDGFIKNFGLEKRYYSIEEMADCVDIGFVQSCNWDKHLEQAMPFIERGKPVFLDKPVCGNIRDCRKLEDLATKGAVILGSSSMRYSQEVEEFNAAKDDMGDILNLYGTVGVDEFNYAIHVVETLGGLLGTGVVSTRFIGKTEVDSKVCETYFVRFDNGVTATYNTFQGTWHPCHIVAMTTKGTRHFAIDTSKLYGALLDRICDYMETGNNRLAGMTELTESVKIMLAGRISRETGGGEVKLSYIPEDDDPGFDGGAFEESYASMQAGNKMYLNS